MIEKIGFFWGGVPAAAVFENRRPLFCWDLELIGGVLWGMQMGVTHC